MSPYEAWRLIEDVAKECGVELYGMTRYDKEHDSMIVQLRRGSYEISVSALGDYADPIDLLRRVLGDR